MTSEVETIGTGIKPVPSDRQDITRNVVVPRRHPGRWIAVAVLVLFALQMGQAVLANLNFHWDVYLTYLFAPQVIRGWVGRFF